LKTLKRGTGRYIEIGRVRYRSSLYDIPREIWLLESYNNVFAYVFANPYHAASYANVETLRQASNVPFKFLAAKIWNLFVVI